jgi:hypothetical protein
MSTTETATQIGLCLCGCGERTQIARYNFPARGWVKGQPRRYVVGHNARVSLPEQFWRHVQKTGSCWLWTGTTAAHGYGQMRRGGRTLPAHRVSYELLVGPIPPGLHIDHLCRVRACVNPAHLEAVTQKENNRRAHAVRKICRHGHPLDGVRPNGYRYCRECKRLHNQKRRKAA